MDFSEIGLGALGVAFTIALLAAFVWLGACFVYLEFFTPHLSWMMARLAIALMFFAVVAISVAEGMSR